MYNKLSLIQLTSGRHRNFVIDVLDMTPAMVEPLNDVLDNPRILKSIHDAVNDLKHMKSMNLKCDPVFDTKYACDELEMKFKGFKALVKKVLKVDISKDAQHSLWSR